MPGSTYSTNLKVELMATGENSGTWGDITNTNLGTALEQAIVGYGNPDYASDANLTISITNSNAAQAARALVLNVTSSLSLTATRELVVPTIQKQYIVQNNTTGSQSITVKTSAGTGITVPNGRKAHLYVNGTDVIQMFDFVDINGGAIDGTPIGASSASTGAFTTLNASGATTLDGNVTLGNASGDNVTVTGTITSNLLFTDNTYDIGASGATRPRNLFLAGAATIGGNLSVGGTLTLTGGVNLNGNVTVGDNATDTLTINSTITSNLIFTDNTYDIGASGATRPRNLFLAGNATIGGNQTLTGSLTVDSTTDSSSTTTGSIQTDGGLGVAKALYVGTTANIAGNVTLSGGTANGVLYLNGSKVATSGSALTFDGATLSINNGVASASVSLTGTYVGSGTVAFMNFQRVGGAVAGTLGYDDANNAIRFGTTTNHSTIFLQNNAEAMRLTSTGLIAQQGAVFNESGADSDFRIESDNNAQMFFVDASTDRIGIGTNVPSYQMDFGSGTTVSRRIRLQRGSDDTDQNMLIGWDGIDVTRSSVALSSPQSTFSINQVGSDGTRNTFYVNTDGGITLNEGGYDADFRVESDTNTHALFVDAGNSKVGINWSAPSMALTIGAVSATGAITNISQFSGIQLNGNQANVSKTGIGYQDGGGGGAAVMFGRGGSYNTDISFFTNSVSNTSPGGMTERGYMGDNGYFYWYSGAVFNENGDDADFRVESDNNTHALFIDAGSDYVSMGTASAINNGQLNVLAPSSRQAITAQVTTNGNSLFQGFSSSGGSAVFQVTGNGDLIATGSLSTNGNVVANLVNGSTIPSPQRYMLVESSTNNAIVSYALGVWEGANNRRGSMFLDDSTGTWGWDVTASSGVPIFQWRRAGTEYFRVGDEVVVNDASLDLDFRVESDTNTHALFVDAGVSKVAVNTSTLYGALTVFGSSVAPITLQNSNQYFEMRGKYVNTYPSGGTFTLGTVTAGGNLQYFIKITAYQVDAVGTGVVESEAYARVRWSATGGFQYATVDQDFTAVKSFGGGTNMWSLTLVASGSDYVMTVTNNTTVYRNTSFNVVITCRDGGNVYWNAANESNG